MLRRVYGWIIRLHPRRFRDRFGPQMLSIFDDSQESISAPRLLADGAVSVARQWALRSRSGIAETAEPVPWSADGAPVFYILGDYRPRTSSLITGGMLTLVAFCAVWLVSEYTWTHPVFMPLVTVQFDAGPALKTPVESPVSALPLQAIVSSSNEVISARSRPQSAPTAAEPSPMPLVDHSVSQPPVSAPVTKTQASAAFAASGASHATKTAAPVIVPAVPERTLLSYTGLYTTGPPNALHIAVTADGGRLAIQIAGEASTRLAALGGTDFMFFDSESDLVEFIKHGHGPAYDLVVCRNGRRLTAHRARPHNR